MVEHSNHGFKSVIILLLIASYGCGDNVALRSTPQNQSIGIEVPTGTLQATPPVVDFGEVCIGAQGSVSVTLENVGDAELTIQDITTSSSAEAMSFAIQNLDAVVGLLQPGEQRIAEFSYTPTGDGQLIGTVEVNLGSFTAPLILEAFATNGGPQLFVTPDPVDLGAVPVGGREVRSVTLRNNGTGVLSVSTVVLDPRLDDLSIGLSSGAEWRPQALESGQSLSLDLALAPTAFQPEPEGPLAMLTVNSNDCLMPATEVEVLGWPGGLETPCPEPPTKQERLSGRDALPADILFIIDNSDSMEDEQEALAAGFAEFIETAETLSIDYRLGVTTTDASEFGALSGLVTSSSTSAAEFTSAVQVGVGGSDNEQGLQAAASSLAPGGGFYPHVRPNSVLSLVFVSDEEDKSNKEPLDYLGDYSQTPASQLLIHAIVEPPDLDGEDTCETAEVGARYVALADETGGYSANICDADFSQTLYEIGVRAFGYRTTFNLSDAAVPDSVVVKTCPKSSDCDEPSNRTLCPDWTLSPDGLTVRFDSSSPCLPTSGHEVFVDYEMICQAQ